MAQGKIWLRSAAIAGLAGLLLACGGEKSESASERAGQVAAPEGTANDVGAALGQTLRGANVLVFSRTAGFRHQSIEAGLDMFDALSAQYGFDVVKTEDPSVFSDAQIGAFDAVVFLNTTGDVLNGRQQRAFERYIQSGGGFVGIHAAADTETDGSWPWYIRLVGGTFAGHPMNPSNVQQARLSRVEGAGAMAAELPDAFSYVDEWYDFNNLNQTTRPILMVDRDSYVGAIATGLERIAWFHDYDGGRAFYTNLGHRDETFGDEFFQRHLLNGLAYAAKERQRAPLLDGRPDPDRFVKDVLIEPLDEPVSIDVRADGSVLIVERPGRIKRWREGQEVEIIGEPDVHYPGGNSEFGLIALASVPHDRPAPIEGGYVMYNLLDEDEQILQRLAYVPFKDGRFDFNDERRLFDIPTDPNCCHTGGAVRFGPDGYLYVAVGDNSLPHGLDGLAPLSDEDLSRDARRTSGNTQDLRGKILRIAPSTDGSYEIPDGNLFADAEQGRPEIYVMGARNPYTIGFDAEDGSLYFGDIGPDARTYTDAGPRGYDEINRVTQAGNFGWPFFIGDNRPYFLTQTVEGRPRRLNNPLAPQNDSPRNTGPRDLPPAQPALIWYPYTVSERFPEMGAGGRNALVVGVYRRPQNAGDGAWPSFFEGQLIISEFMRRYLKSVAIDEAGAAAKITSVAEEIELSGPLDLQFGPDGALYVVEYGTRWFTGNNDARLSRVRYTGSGNRAPQISVALDRVAGTLPFNVSAGIVDALDPDGDEFTVEWAVAPVPADAGEPDYAALFRNIAATGDDASLAIEAPGRYMVIARAKDSKGAVTYSHADVFAGNEPPRVSIEIEGNRSFFWPGRQAINYRVAVSDAEDGSSADGSIDAERIVVRASTEKIEQAPEPLIGHQTAAQAAGPGSNPAAMALLAEHTCTSCHQIDQSSIGPAYRDVAARYAGQSDGRAVLERSLLEGSAQKWGDLAMPAFDYVSEADRAAIIDFILSLHDSSTALPTAGSVSAAQFINDDDEFVLLTARYSDEGSGDAPSLTGVDEVRLRSNAVSLASVFTEGAGQEGVSKFTMGGNDILIISGGTGAAFSMGAFDLTGIGAVNIRWGHNDEYWEAGGLRIELREGGPDGALLAAATLDIAAGRGQQNDELSLAFENPVEGERRLFMRVIPAEGASDGTQVAFTHAVFQPRSGGCGGETLDPVRSGAAPGRTPVFLSEVVFMFLLPLMMSAAAASPAVSEEEMLVVRARRLVNPLAVSVETLDADAIAVSTELAAALMTAPGVDIVRPGAAGATEIFLRGGDANFTAVTLDGVRLNDVTDSRGGAVDVGAIAPFEIERISIAKGAVSVLEGSDALSGQIALETDDPREGPRVEAMASYAERGVWSVNGRVTPWRVDNAALSLAGTHFDLGSGPGDQTFTRSSVGGKLAGSAGGGDWRLAVRHGEMSRAAFPDASGGDRFAVLRELEQSDSAMTTLSLRFAGDEGEGWTPSAAVTYLRRVDDRSTPAIPPERPAAVTDTAFQRITAVGALSRPVSQQWKALVGAELVHERGRTEGALDFGFPVPVDFQQDRTTPSLFAEARRQGGPAGAQGAIDLYLGVRLDYVDAEQAAPTFRAGLAYRLPGERTSLHASVGSGFKSPSFYALGDPLVGNPDLEDERSITGDISIRHMFSLRTSAKITAFYAHYTDLIDFDGATFSLVNRSSVDMSGVEASAEHGFGPFELSAFAAYTNVDAPAGAVLLRPDWRAGVRGKWSAGPFSVHISYRYRSETEASSVPTGIVTLDGSHRFDMLASYRLTEGVAVALMADDLFDSEDEAQPGFTPLGRRIGARLDIAY